MINDHDPGADQPDDAGSDSDFGFGSGSGSTDAVPGGSPNPFSSVYPAGFMPFPHLERRTSPSPGDSAEYGYPQGPGYAPLPRDHTAPRGDGYTPQPWYLPEARSGPEAGYLPEEGYVPEERYVPEAGAVPEPRHMPEAGYGPSVAYPRGAAPLMEPLPDLDAAGPPPPRPPHVTPPPPLTPSLASRTGLEQELGAQTSDSLTTEFLLHGKRPAPGSGWRRAVYRATGGLFRVGESTADMRRRDLVSRVKTPVAGGHHRVAVLSLKGGVGKTTTAVGLGATLASFRGDRVIAVDANPDRGTLSDKVRLETAATIRDLLNERGQVRRYADVRAFTSQAPSRLEVLASDRDPAVSTAFNAGDYCDAARVLEHFYSICITDCGTGLLHSAMAGVLRLADQIVLVSSPSVDGARSASATLDWLDAHEYGDLVRNGVVVLSAIRPKSKSTVDLDRLEQHFAARCRAVARIPYDSYLEEGAEVELELLSSDTAEAYLALAAIVGDGFAWPRRLFSHSALPRFLPYAGCATGGLA